MNSGAPEKPLSTYEAQLAFVWTIVFLLLALLAVLGRLASQHLKGTKPGLDDFLIIAGTAIYFVQGIMVFLTIFTGGVGHLLSNLQEPETKLKNLFRLVTLIQYPYGLCMGLIRCSILVLILRLFGLVASRTFKLLVYTALTITVGQVLYVVLNASLLCRPFEANWDKTILVKNPHAKCGNATNSFIVVAAWGIFCDMIIFFLPIPQTIKLVLGKRQRILLFLVFGLGIADIVVGAFRVVAVTNSGLNDPNTITVNVAQGIIWGMAEPSIAVMVACGPILWHLIDKWIPSHFKSWASSIVRSAKSVNKKVRSSSDQTSYRQMDDQIELVLQEEGSSSQIASSRATPRPQI